MATPRGTLEVHGERNIPDNGVLIVSNRLKFEDLLHLEKMLGQRRVVYLIEHALEYDPLLQAHLEKPDVEGVEFSLQEGATDAVLREIHSLITADCVVVFITGMTRARSGQTVEVPTNVLKFLSETGAPLLPLYVDHPDDTAVATENLSDIDRVVFSFGRILPRESGTLANFYETLLVAGEKAFSNRPILESHLAYELLKGLKKHGTTNKVLDGNDGT
ncbi:MAG: 1-acyl-sn-glycerol-3-phosphate acyltransferase, partial [Verrucomicrobiota bacterium]